MGCLPFFLPDSGSPPPQEVHFSHPTSSSFSVFFLPLSDSFLLSDPHSTSSKNLENKKYLSRPQTPESLADHPAYTGFLLKLPSPWKMFWMFILTWFYFSGKRTQTKMWVCTVLSQAGNLLGCHSQSLSPNDSFFIVSTSVVAVDSCSSPLLPGPGLYRLKPGILPKLSNQSFQFEAMYK